MSVTQTSLLGPIASPCESLAERDHDAWGPGVEAEGRVTFTSMEDKDVAVRIDPDATRLAG